MTATSWFDSALPDAGALEGVFEPPSEFAVHKQTERIDPVTAALIAATPIVFVATSAADGTCDVTPRGGPPGFVTVLDESTVAIPDATGNRRIDSYRNVVTNGHAGLMFVVPGRGQTLRINGRACVSADPDLLDRLTAVGKPPRVALVVRADELFAHCPKAFVRSRLWEPDTWPGGTASMCTAVPTPAELSKAHIGDPDVTIEAIERSQREALLYRLE